MGTPQEGHELTATLGSMADTDVLPATFPDDYDFQWVRLDSSNNPTNVGTNSSTYTVLPADVDSTIRVDVSFTDGAGNLEGPLMSTAVGPVVALLPVLSFAETRVDVDETAGTVELTVNLAPASTGIVTVDYATSNGTSGFTGAEAGEDYTAQSDTLTFTAGETSKTITIQITDDDIHEGVEFFVVDLANPSGAMESATAGRTEVHITSEDSAPVASMDDVTVDEGADTMRLTLRLSHPSSRSIVYSTDSGDVGGTATVSEDYSDFLHSVNDTFIQIVAGERTKDFDIAIIDDGAAESDETITIEWTKATGDQVTPDVLNFTGTITDNDGGTVTVPAIVTDGVQVTSTAATGDTYGLGETIEITVTFDNAVTVDTSGGTPRIQFRLGPPRDDRWAAYSSGSGGTALVFIYTVQSGDMDNDGIWLEGNFLQLQSGTIRAAADNTTDATLTYAEPGLQSVHKVNGAVTAVVPGAPTGLAATGAGRSIELAWEPPAGAVTGYRIESSADGSDPWTEVEADTGSDATDYRHRGLAPEETRHYRVYAINAAGTGTAASNVASATTLVDGRGALLIPSPLVVDEGTARSYTVELTEAPTGTVRVTVAGASGTDVTLSRNRLTFTTTNWGIPQTVTVTAREDGDAVDDTVTLTHTVSRGGGYDDVVLPDLEVTVADNDGGIVASPAALTVAEGGTGSYGLTLTRRPTSDVTVTVMEAAGVTADQATLTFTADNWDTAQPVTVTGSQDGNKNDETVTVRHAATGGGYAVAAGDALSARVTVTVHDDEATAPGAPVLNMAVAGNESATLRWTPPNDDGGAPVTGYKYRLGTTGEGDDVDGGDARSVAVGGLENGIEYTFEVRAVNRIGPGAWSAAKTVTPVPLTLTVEAVSETVTEGEPVVYRIVMSNRTAGVEVGVVYRYKGKFLSTEPSSTVTGIRSRRGVLYWEVERETVDDAEGEANGKFTVRIQPGDGYTLGTSSSVTVTIVDNDGGESPTAPGVTVSKPALTVAEEDTDGDSYTVVLDTEPTADVTVTVAGHADTDVTPDPATLTFTTSNWDTARTVTVTAGDDADTTDDTVMLTHSTTSTDGNYSGIGIAPVAVTVNDNDTAQVTGVSVAPGNARLAVSWTAVDNATGYKVQWKSGSEGYDTGDRQATVTPGSITSHTISGLANGTAYTVRAIATRTGANDGPPSAEMTGTPAVPTAPGVTVSKTALTVAEEDTDGDSYTVVLDTEPTADVTVTVAGHADTDVTPDPATLTFTTSNWDTARTVTVTAGDDADTTDDTVMLTHSTTSTDGNYSGIGIAPVAVTVNDNDTAQVTGVSVAPGNARLAVSWTAVDNATGYKVQWKSGSEGYDTGDRQATVTPGSTTSHTISGLANGTAYTVRAIATRTGANDGPPSAEMTGTPAVPTAPGVTVSKPALTVAEEDTDGDSYTVVLDTEPTADVTVTVAGHADTDVTPDPATLTFTTSNWDTARTVTVTAGDDADTTDDTVMLTHSTTSTDGNYSGIGIAPVAVTVNDNDTAQVTGVSVAPGNARLAVSWTAVDNATGYKVQWKSGSEGYDTGDRQATVTPGSITSHTISGLANGTAYTVRAIATRTGANDGPPSAEMTGTPAVPTAPGVTVSKTALTVAEEDTDGDSYTVVLDIRPTASVTVTVAGHVGTDVTPDPATLTFSTSDWNVVQRVTVTAADDADTTDDSVTLTHRATSTDGNYSGIEIAEVAVTVNDNDTAQAPVVTGAHLASGPGPDGVWRAGDTVEAVVEFSEAVTVDTTGGAPALAIVLGGQRREAVYDRGSGTAALVFRHAVGAADDGARSARVVAGGLSLNGATIRNAAGVDAVLGFELAPAVTSVAVAPDPDGDGRWSPGEAVTVTVGFSDEVAVDTSGGTPALAVELGGQRREAVYAAGSGTAALRFAYTVTADDGAATSVQVPANALTLDGGAIVGPTGLAAGLAHAGASRTGTPGAPALSVADASAAEGGTLVFVVTLDRAAAATVAVVDWTTGDGTARAGEDYTAASGTLLFAPGETAKTVDVAVLEDDEAEGAETVELTLSNAVGAGLADATATGTVSDPTGEPPAGPPPAISVADARVQEGPDAVLAFAVTLDRASPAPVTVDWETLDGGGKAGATAGEDYVAGSGTLRFAPGDTAKTVDVAVLDDAHDEGREVMLLLLTNAVGATIDDAVAKGTIENSDRMPKAWLARFGRTVAEQVLDAVEDRLRAAPRAGVEARLAGEALPSWDGGSRPGGRDRPGSGEDARNAAALAKAEGAEAQAGLAALTDWPRVDRRDDPGSWSGAGSGDGSGDGRRATLRSRAVTERDFLTGTSFALTAEAAGGAGLVSLWGRGAFTRFDGRERGPGGDLRLEGEVGSAMLGADWTGGRDRPGSGAGAWTAGLLLAHSRGEGSYWGAADGAGGNDGTGGTVSSSVTGLYPYGRYRVTDRVTLWGVAGHGAGTLTLTPEDADGKALAPLRSDMELMMAALGVRGVAVEAPADGGFELAGTSDAMVVRTSSEKTSGLEAATADVTRLRLGLEGSWRGLAFGGHELTPSLEVGIRRDGGDAETGFGADIGAGLAWSHAKSGVSAEVSARGLLTHAAGGFRERGIAGSFSWNPRQGSDRGPSLTLSQTLGGSSQGGMDALLGRETLAGLAANDNGEDGLGNRRLELRLGYGFSAIGNRFTLTPELGFGLSNGRREYSLGWRLKMDRGGTSSLELRLEATRRESANDNAEPENGIGFKLTARW